MTLLSALLLAAAVSPSPISPGGRVSAPEGFRATLPSGFEYAVRSGDDGRPFYVASAPGGRSTVMTTSAVARDSLACGSDDAEEMGLEEIVTRSGLRACRVVEGTWWAEDDTLTLTFEDGEVEGEFAVGDPGMIFRGRFWERASGE